MKGKKERERIGANLSILVFPFFARSKRVKSSFDAYSSVGGFMAGINCLASRTCDKWNRRDCIVRSAKTVTGVINMIANRAFGEN